MLNNLLDAFINLSPEKQAKFVSKLTKGIREYWSDEEAIVDGMPIGGIYVSREFGGIKIVKEIYDANH